jgi:hypothetical protein
MKTIQDTTFQNIDTTTSEGQLLKTAVCLIGFLKFRDKKPDLILDVVKDVLLNPLVNEPLNITMERMVEKHNSKQN